MGDREAGPLSPCSATEDYLTAIAHTRPTLTPDILTEFEQDKRALHQT